MKRIIPVMLVIAMLMSVFSGTLTASAAVTEQQRSLALMGDDNYGYYGDFKYWSSPYSTTAEIVNYFGNDTDVVIPDKINDLTVTGIADRAFNSKRYIKSVTIPASVAELGTSAFYNCTALEKVSFKGSRLKVGSCAFSGCVSLAELETDSPRTVFASLGSEAFCGCKSMKKGYVPCEQGTKMEMVFKDCTSLEELASSIVVAIIGDECFANCTSLKSVSIAETVREIKLTAFSGCSALENITVSESSRYYYIDSGLLYKRDTSNSEELTLVYCAPYKQGEAVLDERTKSVDDDVFLNNDKLTKIVFNDAVSMTLSHGSVDLSGCSALEEIDLGLGIRSFDGSGLKDCFALKKIVFSEDNEWFASEDILVMQKDSRNTLYYLAAPDLEEYTLPDKIRSMDSRALINCRNLKKLSGSSSVQSEITRLGLSGDESKPARLTVDGITYVQDTNNNFSIIVDCSTDISGKVVLSDTVRRIDAEAFKDCTKITEIVLQKDMYYVGARAFENCTSLTAINVPNEHVNFGEACFKGCKALTSIDLSLYNSFTGMICPETFSGCEKLTSVTLSDSYESIYQDAFAGCKSLTQVKFGSSMRQISSGAFKDCVKLKELTFTDSVDSFDIRSVEGCTSLERIKVSSGNSKYYDDNGVLYDKEENKLIFYPPAKTGAYVIPDTTVSINGSAFKDCKKLSSVTIPGSVETVSSSAFRSCTGLTSVTMLGSVKAIDSYAFENCTSLSSVTFADSITKIGASAFKGCAKLTSVTLPSSVEELAGGCFAGTGVEEVVVPPSAKKIESTAFDDCPSLLRLYYPYGAKTIYDTNVVTYRDTVPQILVYSGTTDNIIESDDDYPGAVERWANIALIRENWCSPGHYSGNRTEVVYPTKMGGDTVVGATLFALTVRPAVKRVILPGTVFMIEADAYRNAPNLEEIIVPDDATDLKTYEGCIYSKDLTRLVIAPPGRTGVLKTPEELEVIESNALSGLRKITGIELHEGLREIGANAFKNCETLKKLEIPSTVKKIGNNAFMNCKSLEEIVLPSSLESIDAGAFSGCSSLRSIKLTDCANYKMVGNMLMTADGKCVVYCLRNTEGTVTIPEGTEYINSEAFCLCTGITEIKLPDSLKLIGREAFYGNFSLTEITIPDSVYCISNDAFSSCTSLENVKLGSGIDDIGEFAFKNCNMVAIELPENIKRVGKSAFESCKQLRAVVVYGDETELALTTYIDEEGEYLYPKTRASLVVFCNDGSLAKEAAERASVNVLPLSEWNEEYLQNLPPDEPDTESDTESSLDSEEDGDDTTDTESDTGSDVSTDTAADTESDKTSDTADGTDSDVTPNTDTDTSSDGGGADDDSVIYSRETEGTYSAVAGTPAESIVIKSMYNNNRVTAVRANAFKDDTTLKTVTIMNGVRSIGVGAFKNCTELERIEIPASVSEIAVNAFSGCGKVVIYGSRGSYAQTFAEQRGITFVDTAPADPESDTAGDTDTVPVTNTDTDTASDTSSDNGSDTETPTASDTDTQTDTEVTGDTDSTANSDTQTDRDTETDSEKPVVTDTDSSETTDTDSETEPGTDTSSESGTDSDTNTDTDTAPGSDTDSDEPKEPEDKGSYGDLDGDGQITAGDALAILRASAGMTELDPELTVIADVDGDGSITANDALAVLRNSAGIDGGSNIGQPVQ